MNPVWILLKREMRIMITDKVNLFAAIGFPILLVLLIGFGFKDVIQLGDGSFNYIDYLSPGIIILFAVMTSFQVGYNIFYDKHNKFIKEILISPISRLSIILGHITMGLIASLFFWILLSLILPLLLGSFQILALLQSIPIVVLGSITFGGLGILFGYLAGGGRNAHQTIGYAMVPLYFLSGVFFPISSLPIWLKIIAYANPLYYTIDLIRTIQGMSGELPLPLAYGILIAFSVVFVTTATILFQKKSTQ